MTELIPIVLGVALALSCEAVQSRHRRHACWMAGSVVVGVAVTVVTGEWMVSPAFVFIDVPLVALSAYATRAVLLRLAKRIDTRVLARYRRQPAPS